MRAVLLRPRCRVVALAALLALASPPPLRADGPVPAGYQGISFTQLSAFEYELPDPLDPDAKPKPNQVPAAVKALDGRKVAIRGFMLPVDMDSSGVREFLLNASIDLCYFGAPVNMNEWILVKMKPGTTATFTHMGILVAGRLEVGEQMANGRVLSLYRLHADSAEIVK